MNNKYTGIAQLIHPLEPASSYQLLSQATRTSGIYPGLLRMNKTWLFHLENTTCLSPSGSSFKTSGGPIIACMVSNRLTESDLRHHLHHFFFFFFFFSDGLYATRGHGKRVSRSECYCKGVEMARSFYRMAVLFFRACREGF